ncbi:MAG: AhpC/TSA family protein [Wenzhouxiangellaceae bacterium]|nr:AhpC/TSA family protein [Wenzhouxiangellaceae bacterium]MBS3746703.1 AhpC/TSA family protein [Wenzhouxiangellaceae bacterium]MBS3822665.1 AhpC/TSA family protein [Wenzhouxiangellaceae bacterium]
MRAILLASLLLLPTLTVAEIFAAPEQVRPVLPGMQAPEFRVLNVDGNEITVDPADLERPVVVTFYRGGWCPYCNMHLAELRTTEAELTGMGFDVWFISPDKPELLAEGDDSEFGYRLLSDPGMNAAQAFGIAFRLDDETFERYVGFGNDLNERSGADHQALPAPATFIIGNDGKVQFGYVNPDYSVRLAPEVLLAAARAYSDGAHKRMQRSRGE